MDIDWLANVIRTVDGNNSLGAGALAEAIVAAMSAAPAPQPVHSCPNCLGVDPDSCALDRSPQPVHGEAVAWRVRPHDTDISAARVINDARLAESMAAHRWLVEPLTELPTPAAQIAAPDHIADARKMVAAPGDVEARARELLATEYERENKTYLADCARDGETTDVEDCAIRAISAALRSQGQADAVGLAQFREAVVHWRTGYFRAPTDAGERVRAESARLLAVIDTAALAQQANKEQPHNT